jgi:hypothetical protein
VANLASTGYRSVMPGYGRLAPDWQLSGGNGRRISFARPGGKADFHHFRHRTQTGRSLQYIVIASEAWRSRRAAPEDSKASAFFFAKKNQKTFTLKCFAIVSAILFIRHQLRYRTNHKTFHKNNVIASEAWRSRGSKPSLPTRTSNQTPHKSRQVLTHHRRHSAA